MAEPFRYLSLFSGIGGFELAAQIANQEIGFEAFQPAALCENNPFCQRVLNYHYPTTPLIPDVRKISVEFIRELGRIDGIVGGFPCQNISNSGDRTGLEGERSGLFYEIIRIVRLVRPRFIYLENVAALLGRGLREVLWEFAAIGYDAEWSIIPCSTLGGSHKRERIWIIAYPNSVPESQPSTETQSRRIGRAARMEPMGKDLVHAANTSSEGLEKPVITRERSHPTQTGAGMELKSERYSGGFNWQATVESLVRRCHDGVPVGLADDAYLLRLLDLPDWMPYAADSLPIAPRKEALQALGNAIVPQVGAIGFLKIYSLLAGKLHEQT